MTVAELLELLRDARARVAVIVCELEAGEWTAAYATALDLERDLERRLDLEQLADAA